MSIGLLHLRQSALE